jgi:hypothetical protein
MSIKKLIKTLNVDQKDMFDILNSNNKYQFRVPTGVGKGYLMILHILYNIIKTKNKKFVIASHRLSLNNQHLRDLINYYIDLKLISKVKFLSVGSQALNISKLLADDKKLGSKFNNQLYNYNNSSLPIKGKLEQRDIFRYTLCKNDVNEIIKRNDNDGFKTIIITTYNSLSKINDQEIDIIYLDEAHMLATEKDETEFKKSYNSIISTKSFFFSATPKDVDEQMISDGEITGIFLMNNINIFGKIYQMPFIKCVINAYITKPLIHFAKPGGYDCSKSVDYNSIHNKGKFIKETFNAHEAWLKQVSVTPDEIDAKVLVRCESVKHMWEMYDQLITIMPIDVTICAGASYNNNGKAHHVIGDRWENNRDEFVKEIQNMPDNQKLIILNYDIFSEGINVPGITGVLFLQGKMPTIAKVIQNVGRATRLHKKDREMIAMGKIGVNDYTKWVKPYCAVIIPYWDDRSETTMRLLANTIRKLRDSWGFDPRFIMSIGDDYGDSDYTEPLDGLNELYKRNKKIHMIEEIENEIEILDSYIFESEEIERLQTLTDFDWIKMNFGL